MPHISPMGPQWPTEAYSSVIVDTSDFSEYFDCVEHYDIEAIASVDARGQIVLPKSARVALGLEPGSKLAVAVKRQGGTPCCITLMPVGALEERVKEVVDARAGSAGSEE